MPDKIDRIYISNISEDVWPFIDTMSDPYEKSYEIEENAKLSDRELFSFSGSDNTLLILPTLPVPQFFAYFKEITHSPSVFIAAPKIHTGETCRDIIHDANVMEYLKLLPKTGEKISLLSYSSSKQFYDLYQKFVSLGYLVNLKESPVLSDSWTVDFYGSKSGIRQFSQTSENDEPDFKMPEGLITFGIGSASKIAANSYSKNGGIVMKINKGHSGAGVLIIRPGDIPKDYPECEKAILGKLRAEKYWKMFPMVIEKYIDPNFSIGGGFPNVEFRINKNGKIELLYFCAMRVSKTGMFKGVEINNDVLSDRISAQIIDTGFYIGENYSKDGYRGYYDVDFISAKNGELYVTESNARRTGGTHVYYLAEHLYGEDFMHEIYTLSNNLHPVKNKAINAFPLLYEALSPVHFSKRKKEGVVITSVGLLGQNKFGYVIFGKTKKRAYEIEEKMEKLLQ